MNLKTIIIAVACLIAMPTTGICKDSAARTEYKQKADKEARNEAKRLKKEGWMALPGGVPLDKQLDRAYVMQYEKNEDDSDKYHMGIGQSTAQSFDAARMQATALARQDLASTISTEVTSLMTTSVGNQQLDPSLAATVTQVVSEGKQLVSQRLTNVKPVFEGYRVLKNGNHEVMVRIACTAQTSKDIARQMLLQTMALDDETKQKIADGIQ